MPSDILGLSSHLVHIATSEQEALDIKSSFKTPQRVVILPHFGITPKADALEKAVVKQSGELRLCFTGRIAVQKNLIGAIDILSRVSVPVRIRQALGAIENEEPTIRFA